MFCGYTYNSFHLHTLTQKNVNISQRLYLCPYNNLIHIGADLVSLKKGRHYIFGEAKIEKKELPEILVN